MAVIAWCQGSFSVEALSFFRSVPLEEDNSFQAHNRVESGLRKLGFDTRREVFTEDRGDGFRGKIDLVAVRGVEKLVIEIDRVTARQKSIFKVANYPKATGRIVICRQKREGGRIGRRATL